MLNNLSELITMVVSVLAVIVPFYLYIMFRKAVSKRRATNQKKQYAPEPAPPVVETEEPFAPRRQPLQPAAYERTPNWESPRYSKPPERSGPATREPEESQDIFKRFERYPPRQRAIIFSEILGKPRAFRD